MSSGKVRLLVGSCVTASLLALAFGLWVHWPWLEAEHDRLGPMHRALIWSSDAAAVLWLVWFGLCHGLLGRPLRSDTTLRHLLIGFVGAFAVDVAITAIVAHDELTAPARAVRAGGAIVGGRPTVNGQKAYLACRFQDQNGAWHESRLQVGLVGLPAAVQNGIERGRFPLPVVITYDPSCPGRCWLDGFDNQEDNRLHWMSAALLVFQAVSLPILLCLVLARPRGKLVPLAGGLPVLAQLVPFFLAAAAKFCTGEW